MGEIKDRRLSNNTKRRIRTKTGRVTKLWKRIFRFKFLGLNIYKKWAVTYNVPLGTFTSTSVPGILSSKGPGHQVLISWLESIQDVLCHRFTVIRRLVASHLPFLVSSTDMQEPTECCLCLLLLFALLYKIVCIDCLRQN